MIAIVNAINPGSPSSSKPKAKGPLPALTLSAPPSAAAQAAPCAKVLAQLPVTVHGLAARVVHTEPNSPYVVAWGDPPVILRCGVDRPKDLHAGSGAQFFALGPITGPFWDVTSSKEGEVYTTVDRAAYISVSVPAQYASGPMPALSRAIAKALPAVCSTDNTEPVAKLCTRRT